MPLPRPLPLLLCVISLPVFAQDAKAPPPSANPELIVALVTGGTRVGSEKPVVVLEPLLQYRQGQWEQALSKSITGPKQWSGLQRLGNARQIKPAGVLPTKTKPLEYLSECQNRGWGFPMTAPLAKPETALAFSQDVSPSPFEPAPPESAKVLQRLTGEAAAELLQAARKDFQQQDPSGCTAAAVATLKEHSGEAAGYGGDLQRCTSAQPGLGQLCYARQFRTYVSQQQEGQNVCAGSCVTELWTVDSGAGPRLLTASHVCSAGELRTGGSPPFLAFAKDGHVFILSDNTCYEGCDGFEVAEASATGIRSLASKDSNGACD